MLHIQKYMISNRFSTDADGIAYLLVLSASTWYGCLQQAWTFVFELDAATVLQATLVAQEVKTTILRIFKYISVRRV